MYRELSVAVMTTAKYNTSDPLHVIQMKRQRAFSFLVYFVFPVSVPSLKNQQELNLKNTK